MVLWQLYRAESRKVSLHAVCCQTEWSILHDMQWYYNNTNQPLKILGVTNDNKLFINEHIANICKTANKKLNALSKINNYMKQNQKKNLLSSLIISHFNCCPLICIFYYRKSTKNAVHKRSFWIIRNDYESLYPLL